jgi:hypothetical protein
MERKFTEGSYQSFLKRYPGISKKDADFMLTQAFIDNRFIHLDSTVPTRRVTAVSNIVINVPNSVVHAFWCYKDVNIDHRITLYPDENGVFYHAVGAKNYGE